MKTLKTMKTNKFATKEKSHRVPEVPSNMVNELSEQYQKENISKENIKETNTVIFESFEKA